MDSDGEETIQETNDNIEFEIRIEANNPKSHLLKGAGKLYLTNCRLFLIANHSTQQFKGFEIRNHKIYSEKLEQPVFGANYFHGFIKTYNNIFQHDLEFKIWFKGGNQS